MAATAMVNDSLSPESENLRGRALKCFGAFFALAPDHLWWTISRTLFLGVLVFVLVMLDMPLRVLIEGTLVQQMERAETRELLDEKVLLDDLSRAMSNMDVSLAGLQNGVGLRAAHSEFTRRHEALTNAAKYFDDRFSNRRKVFADPQLESVFYEIRDVSSSIVGEIRQELTLAERRKLSARIDQFKQAVSRARHLAPNYLRERDSRRRVFAQGDHR